MKKYALYGYQLLSLIVFVFFAAEWYCYNYNNYEMITCMPWTLVGFITSLVNLLIISDKKV